MKRVAIPILAAAAAAAAAGCGGDDGGNPIADAPPRPDGNPTVIDAMPDRIVMESYALVPGELVEIIMHGTPADEAHLHLAAPAPVIDWNIHGHDGGDTQTIYEEYDKMTADYVFIPPHETDWYLLVRNGGGADTTIEVRAELYGAMTWSPQ
jgi:hypothetical protein